MYVLYVCMYVGIFSTVKVQTCDKVASSQFLAK